MDDIPIFGKKQEIVSYDDLEEHEQEEVKEIEKDEQ